MSEAPTPQSASQPAPQPAPQSAPQPVPQSAPQPAPQPAPQYALQTTDASAGASAGDSGSAATVASTDAATTPNSSTRRYSAGNTRFRIRLGLVVTILGFLLFLMGVDPGIFGLDRSPVTGFIQIATFLVGLALICMGGYTGLNALWNGTEKTIAADIGLRLVATGYVVAVAAGMADLFGIGNHPLPNIPYFGPWQAFGVMVGMAIIASGFVLLIPYPAIHKPAR
jgi:hypothetical protein